MVLHTNAHNYKQQVAIILNPIEHTESFVEQFFNYNVYVSHHVCKSSGEETGDVNFLPWRTAYFGLTAGSASIF